MKKIQSSSTDLMVKKVKESVASSHQKTFNRLIKKVQDLQAQQEKIACEIDETLQFYYATVRPDELIFLQHLIERVNIAYEFYKTTKDFSKKELKEFKAWLTEKVDQICALHEPNDMPVTIKNLYKELHGTEYDECVTQELESAKQSIQESFKDAFGQDVDLSDVDLTGSQEDIMRNIFMKMGQTATDLKEKSSQAPKTKKQLEKEVKKQAIEEIQAKNLHSVYKSLVRVLHPDLEQDTEKRLLKEELMKKLTVAYEKNDLYSLLKIEMEWMSHSVDKMQSHDVDEIKVYNAILKDQVKELEVASDMLLMHPRYISIQRFYPFSFTGIATLQQQYNNGLKKLMRDVQVMLSRLKTSQANAVFKEIIQEHISMTKSRACPCGSC